MPQSRTRLSAPVSQISLCDSGYFSKRAASVGTDFIPFSGNHISTDIYFIPILQRKAQTISTFVCLGWFRDFLCIYCLYIRMNAEINVIFLLLPQHAEYTSFPAIFHLPVPAYGAMLSGFFCHSHPECSVVHKGLFHNQGTGIFPAVSYHRFLYQMFTCMHTVCASSALPSLNNCIGEKITTWLLSTSK